MELIPEERVHELTHNADYVLHYLRDNGMRRGAALAIAGDDGVIRTGWCLMSDEDFNNKSIMFNRLEARQRCFTRALEDDGKAQINTLKSVSNREAKTRLMRLAREVRAKAWLRYRDNVSA